MLCYNMLEVIIKMFNKKNIYRAWFLRTNNLFLFKVKETEIKEFTNDIFKEQVYLLYPIQSWKLYLFSNEKLKRLRKSVLADYFQNKQQKEN